MPPDPHRYLVFRTDGIGDVILTLPMAEAIKQHDPMASVTFVVQDYTADLVRLCPFVDDIIAINGRDLDGSLFRFSSMLKNARGSTAVFAYPRPKLAFAATIARIPVRVGTAFRGYSFLFTHRVHEHRKDAIRHESVYNLNLLSRIGIHPEQDLLPRLRLTDELRSGSSDLLREADIDPTVPFVALHPGSGGSAKEWSSQNFGLLGNAIMEYFRGMNILVTGTNQERASIQSVVNAIGSRAHSFPRDLTLPELAAVLSQASVCVANSTGPLHIAAAVGTRVIGLYPFRKVMNPRRWGPLGEGCFVFTPEPEPECPDCAAESCPLHDVMDRISVETVFEKVRSLLA